MLQIKAQAFPGLLAQAAGKRGQGNGKGMRRRGTASATMKSLQLNLSINYAV